MYPLLFEFSPGHPLNSWLLMALMGIWTCYFSISNDLKRKGISNQQIRIGTLGGVITWFIGAHIGQLTTVGGPSEAVRSGFQLSGFVLYGGLIALVAYGGFYWWLLGWKRKLSLVELWDIASLGVAWAFMWGRIGCTLYGCCYGSPSGSWPGYLLNEEHWDHKNQSFPKALQGIRLHPATLYESIGFLFIIGIMLWIRHVEKKKPGSFWPGQSGLICWTLYGVIRFFLEFIRFDLRGPSHFGLSPSQWISVFIVGLGLWGLTQMNLTNPKKKVK
jgi:phosphatidylglycerol:prolipoprotein diacylglycerol transferase